MFVVLKHAVLVNGEFGRKDISAIVEEYGYSGLDNVFWTNVLFNYFNKGE